MKKLLSILMLFTLLGCIASAESFTPAMFLGSRGLMVLDQNQLNSMSSQDESENSGMSFLAEYSLAVFTAPSGDNGTPSIVFTHDGVAYFAFDMTAMFGQGTLDAKGMSQVFIDFCNAYDFAIYGYAIEGSSEQGAAYVTDMSQWKSLLLKSGGESEGMASFTKNMVESKEALIEALKAAIQ